MVKKLVGLIVIVLVVWLVVSFFRPESEVSAPAGEEGPRYAESSGEARPSALVPAPGSDASEMVVGASAAAVVTYSDEGFSPQTVGPIEVRDAVVFKNESSREFWPASAMHPTHAVYDGTALSEHCQNGMGGPGVFDACRGIAPGGEWSFKFDKAGTWKYHDHLNSSRFGTVVVE